MELPGRREVGHGAPVAQSDVPRWVSVATDPFDDAPAPHPATQSALISTAKTPSHGRRASPALARSPDVDIRTGCRRNPYAGRRRDQLLGLTAASVSSQMFPLNVVAALF